MLSKGLSAAKDTVPPLRMYRPLPVLVALLVMKPVPLRISLALLPVTKMSSETWVAPLRAQVPPLTLMSTELLARVCTMPPVMKPRLSRLAPLSVTM